jgi:hypothetical protein
MTKRRTKIPSKKNNIMDNIDLDTKKILIQIYLEEYKAAKNEIIKLIEFQDKSIHYTLILLGVILGIYAAYKSIAIILISPLLLDALGFYVLHNLDKIVFLVGYINKILRPKVEQLIGNKDSVFGWDDYFAKNGGVISKTKSSNKFIHISSIIAILFIPLFFLLFFMINNRY